MTKQKLTSNIGETQLFGVGRAFLDNERITIEIEPNATATLTRGLNKVVLLKSASQKQKISGLAVIGDIYVIEQDREKFILSVEEDLETGPENIYINPAPYTELTDQKRKTTLTAGVILLLLLIVSVVFGVQQKKNKELQEKGLVKLTEAISNYDLALNGSTDKNMARELFLESKKKATELKDLGYKNEKLDELIKNISEKESEIVGEIKPEIKEFLDLSLQTSGFDGKNMVSSGEDIFVFDENNKNILKVGIKNKNTKIAANKENIDGTISIGSYEDRLFLNRSDGIYEVDLISKKVIERDWNDTNLIYFYAGNSYLIDKDDNEIYRFAGSNKSFGSKSGWLAPGIEMDFSKIIDMTIDGSIWLLSSTGKVTKLTNGNPQAISLNGIPDPLSNPIAIYTNEDNKNVYILEKDKGRVVVIDKTGEFKLQYSSDEIKNAKDLVVSEEEKKIILLTGSKLMYIELKN